jgi:hypothetical protein
MVRARAAAGSVPVVEASYDFRSDPRLYRYAAMLSARSLEDLVEALHKLSDVLFPYRQRRIKP